MMNIKIPMHCRFVSAAYVGFSSHFILRSTTYPIRSLLIYKKKGRYNFVRLVYVFLVFNPFFFFHFVWRIAYENNVYNSYTMPCLTISISFFFVLILCSIFFRFLSSFLVLPGVVVCHQESQLKSLFLIQSRVAERRVVGREVILIKALAAA